MCAYNDVLPEIVLSTKSASYLMTRNAHEKVILRKKSFLLEKAKTKEERSFQREKELLLQRHSRMQEIRLSEPYERLRTASKRTSQIEDENKWEVSSDTPLYTGLPRNKGFLSTSKPTLCSSHESIFSISTNNRDGLNLTTIPQRDRSTSVRSSSCALPPI